MNSFGADFLSNTNFFLEFFVLEFYIGDLYDGLGKVSNFT